MNKKKYIEPFCRVRVTEAEVLIATSGEEWMDVSEETTDDYADMSNKKRNGGSVWDQGW